MAKATATPSGWKKVKFAALFKPHIEYTDDLEKYPLFSLTIENGVTEKTGRYERSHLVLKSEAYKIVHPNDFVYNPMNVILGAVARYTGNKEVAVSGYYDVFSAVYESDIHFFDSFLTSIVMQRQYEKTATGSLIEKQRVHFSQFMNFELSLPLLKERNAISEIFTTQDRLIALKQRLIDAKKQQKRWLMQNMLTGKVRIPGFSSKWESAKLGDVCSFVTKRTETFDQANYIGTNNMLQNIGGVVKSSITSVKSAIEYKDGDILLSNIRPYLRKLWLADRTGGASTDVIIMRPNISAKYAFLLLSLDSFFNTLANTSKGTKMPRGDKKAIAKYSFEIPSPPEQTAIVEQLTAAEKEIELLTQNLERQKIVKKHLMQQLLTGKMRVKEASAV